MNTFGTVLIFALGGLVMMFCIIAGALKISKFSKEAKYFKMEMGRSDDPEEYAYWQQQLEKHYRRINPFYRIKK